MTDNREKLFELVYGAAAAENMYKARYYVLNKTLDIVSNEIAESEFQQIKDKKPIAELAKHCNFVLENDSDLMLAIARQLALTMHFLNYDESKDKNGTMITICCKDVGKTRRNLSKEKYLCNLMQFCQVYCNGKPVPENKSDKRNDKLPLDIRINLYKGKIDDCCKDAADMIVVKEEDVNEFLSNYNKEEHSIIDVSMAKLVNATYSVGGDINNLSISDSTNVQKYMTALNTFCFHLDSQEVDEAWNSDKMTVKDKLSSVFCADCFTIRLHELLGNEAFRGFPDTFEDAVEKVTGNIELLASHEHSRWNVEKLIMGFMPYNSEQKFEYERVFKKEREAYRKKLKKDNVHLDLCSNKVLRRVDPGNVKYDVFLLLAMPEIVKRTMTGCD